MDSMGDEKIPIRRTPLAEFDAIKKEEFCRELLNSRGMIGLAAKAIGVSPNTIGRHLQKDPKFRGMMEEALDIYRGQLVQEAHRRAVEGVKKPVYFKGEQVGEVSEYDTPLLMMLMRRHMPEFREKTVVENHNVNLDFGIRDFENMTAEQREKIKELIQMQDPEVEDEAE